MELRMLHKDGSLDLAMSFFSSCSISTIFLYIPRKSLTSER